MSPLVPAGPLPDRDLWLAFEHLAEELLNLLIGRERLDRFGGLPLVDAQEVPTVLGGSDTPGWEMSPASGPSLSWPW
jgi:hypothetical protein